MARGEFELIDRYFRRPLPERDDVLVGIGDDGAVLHVAAGRRLVTTVATLAVDAWQACAGDPCELGYDAMAKAMNRLAAAGAQPAWATLALTLPAAEDDWLAAFSEALFAVAAPLSVALVGGDTTRGPFAVTVVGHGLLAAGSGDAEAATRAGDGLFLSGVLGSAAAGARPLPASIRVALGRWIRESGGVAVDASDGLGAALGALLAREPLGAAIDVADLPLADALPSSLEDDDDWRALASRRGDMELCFSLAAEAESALAARAAEAGIPIMRLASVDESGAITLLGAGGRAIALDTRARRPPPP